MIVSLASLILAIAILVYPGPLAIPASWVSAIMGIAGTVVFFATTIVYAIALLPLSKLEQRLVPRLMDNIYRYRPFTFIYAALLVFTLFSYAMAAFFGSWQPKIIWALWLFALGVTLDLFRYQWKTLVRFLNPFYLVDFFTSEGKKAILTEQDTTLWATLDSLSEMTVRSLDNSQIALTMQALNAFPAIMQTFFASSKSISRTDLDSRVEKETGQDEASYTVFYLLQRLDLIQDRAIKKHLETVCNQMIVILGKIIFYGAQYDVSIITFPVHYLTKFALKSQSHHLQDVATMATSTLLEVSKTITREIDLSYVELQDPFNAIINGLENLAKEAFRQDKTINIAILTQPFKDLKALFETEKMAKHRDIPVIIQNIDRVLGEFAALEQIMRTIPPIPNLPEEPQPTS